MRTFLLTALSASMAMASCRKSSQQPQGIVGKWQLRKEVGGFVGTILYQHGHLEF